MNNYLVGFIIASAIFGCSKNDDGLAVQETMAATAPPTSEMASAEIRTPTVVKKAPDIEDEALAFATDYMNAHLITCKGALVMTANILQGPRIDVRQFQLLEPAVKLDSVNVTDVDRLNGLEWFGRVHILAKAYRTTDFSMHNEWSEWQDPELTHPYPYVHELAAIAKMTGEARAMELTANIEHGLWVHMKKHNKQWQMNAGSHDWNGAPFSFNVVDTPDCSTLPKETASNEAMAQPAPSKVTVPGPDNQK